MSISKLPATVYAALSVFGAGIFYNDTLPQAPADFTPVVRFAVCSDVHLNGDPGQTEAKRLAKHRGATRCAYAEISPIPAQPGSMMYSTASLPKICARELSFSPAWEITSLSADATRTRALPAGCTRRKWAAASTGGNASIPAVLAKYPQAVDFSEHSHYPVNDPRSIWQGGYTVLDCGTLSYFETELDGIDGQICRGKLQAERNGKRHNRGG